MKLDNPNNVTAPIEDNKPNEETALQKLLPKVEITSFEDIVNIFEGEGVNEEVTAYFRKPLEIKGLAKNDLRPSTKTEKLAQTIFNVFAVAPEEKLIDKKVVEQTNADRLWTAIDTQKDGYRLEARKGGLKVPLHTAIDIGKVREFFATAVNDLNEKDIRKDKYDVGFNKAEGETKQIGNFVKITGQKEDLEFSLELVQKIKPVAPKEVDPAKKDGKPQEVVTN